VMERPRATRAATAIAPRPTTHDTERPMRHAAAVESALVDFVVEQTGYPREMVELDADLEAELGIDSIRKAQLVGEIGQRYGLRATDDVSLDELPTLRHLLEYLLPRVEPDAAVAPPPARPAKADSPALAATASAAARPVAVDGFHVVVVAPRGTPALHGIAACFGRHTVPHVRRLHVSGMATTLVSATSDSDALAGWNDAGLIAVACHTKAATGSATQCMERLLTTCQSLDAARRAVTSMSEAPAGITVLDRTGEGFHVAPDGALEQIPETLTACNPRSPLARVALADGTVSPQAAVAALLDPEDSTARDALSATCAWFACGVAGDRPTVTSGGPVAGLWLAAEQQTKPDTARTPGDGEITRRYTLALRDLGPTRRVRSLAHERVLIVGRADDAEPLSRAVTAQGGVPIVADCATAEQAVAVVDRAEQVGTVRHLVVLSPRDDAPGNDGGWVVTRETRIAAPFFACQRWTTLRSRAGDLASSTLTAAIELGGDFGLSGTIPAVTGAGLAGLFKGLAREFPALHVRVVDAAAAGSEPAAAAVITEMLDAAGPVEVGLSSGRRMTVVAEERASEPTAPLPALTPGSVWLVTGGGRGITAACARELARRYGLVLALVGSTEPVEIDPSWTTLVTTEVRQRVMLDARGRGHDPRLAWRAVEKSLEIAASLATARAAGVDARYFACDLADAAAVRSLVQQVIRELGPIRGLLHGAGYESACRFERKTRAGLDSTLAAKCLGLEHLLAHLDRTTLDAVVGFGSTSGRLGGHGQADYSLANELLAKRVVQLRGRQPSVRGTVFHWHAWDEIGMASRPESRFVLEQFGLRFMPVAEGVRRFMAEIEAGLPAAEVLVTEPACVPATPAAREVNHGHATAARGPRGRGSLVDDVVAGADATRVWFQLDPTSDRFLLDHLRSGRPLLPAVMGAELLAQAALAAGACGDVREIRDFAVEHPLAFPTDAPRRVRVDVTPRSGGVHAAAQAASARAASSADGRDVLHLRATLLDDTTPIHETVSEPPLPFNPMVYAEHASLWHGGSFRTLTGLFLDRSGGWGRLLAPAPGIVAAPRGAAGWTVPVALLDGCLVACGVYSYILCGQRVEVPVRFERLQIAAAPRAGEQCTLRLLFRDSDPAKSLYDFVLFGDDGRPLLALHGLHLAVTATAERGH
jgi:NAD(P)-dependent dehydrogenase (short-subunit alcohol dehydrogenase family)/acyl carrier protein